MTKGHIIVCVFIEKEVKMVFYILKWGKILKSFTKNTITKHYHNLRG